MNSKKSGTLTLTTSSSHSFRAKTLYLVLRLFYSPVISRFVENPAESGHQHIKPPKSLSKKFTIKKRDFYDWSVYDISIKPSSKPKSKLKDQDAQKIPERRMMYIPGTGFTISTSSEHFKFVSKTFVSDPYSTVTVVLHPLAPKHTISSVYPKFFELYSQLLDELTLNGEIDIGGDSSGGGISLSIVQHLNSRGLRLPNRLFIMAPSVDFVQPKASDMKKVSDLDPLQRVDQSHAAHLKWVNGEMPLSDPIVSPIRGNFHCLKGIKVVGLVGTYDILEPDCIRLREKMRDEGIEVEWLVGEKMVHCWPLMQAYLLPEGKEAVGWIRQKMK
ncbi:hypothetical protein TWF569_009020 [Orbilia oligospora]|uniref:Alpha/beta hydrolase fold-3 domain-containing protein n=1 Tax=Orbilia oligospora TaxID=2813651 RepID=A0A7C8NDD5_ORBOL|nr:hypothetical protein TWF102_008403 [Orbilia oligospora]KAF3096320.1 hypothetical protein TWF103_009888 [Orbilia oligospora]KAF3098000.1 hypothetical protein TWF706_006939 [Orbilia oligospora]KAF3145461.1 hypothetical protein TWF594_004394 [Orbilia oligospora]KAF3155661.1 hypothetical protein TWF569_009020 [Orbilia oligospora]